jgi:hypothetical protein
VVAAVVIVIDEECDSPLQIRRCLVDDEFDLPLEGTVVALHLSVRLRVIGGGDDVTDPEEPEVNGPKTRER